MQDIGSWWLPRRPRNPELSDIPEFKTKKSKHRGTRGHGGFKSLFALCFLLSAFCFLRVLCELWCGGKISTTEHTEHTE